MSQLAGNESGTQGSETPTETQNTGFETQTTQPTQSNNAPYAQYLERLPESVRGIAEPIFKEWDAGVTQQFQKVHSDYAWAKDWQELAQAADPETVSNSLAIWQALNSDPQAFYKSLGEAYGYTAAQAQQIVEQGLEEPQQGQQLTGLENDPRFQQLEQVVGSLADTLISERQAQQNAAEEEAFYTELNRLQQLHGEFDPDYVITKVAAGIAPEDAVLQYRALIGQHVQQAVAPGQSAPVVMGAGGGVPSQNVDLKSLDRKKTQDLVSTVLAANNRG